MITKEFAQGFAQDWIDSWNTHDLARILSHYSDDFEMTSPFISTIADESNGSLKGKENVAKYWQNALTKLPDLKFELRDVLFSMNTIVIYYQSVMNKMAAEVMFFNDQGKVVKSIAHYDSF